MNNNNNNRGIKILTFDIEEWFHLLDFEGTKSEADWAKYPSRIHRNVEAIFSVLDATETRATFFCLGWIARKHPDVVKMITSRGYEIASHSDLHQLAYEQSPNAFREDLERSIKTLEDISGQKVKAYRAPGFSIKPENKSVFEVLIEFGIEIDCSVFPARRSHGGFDNFGTAKPCWINVNGSRLKEFPINTYSILGKSIVFSGGGYFRLLPLWAIQYLIDRSDYVMTYFHPRDIDAGQVMIKELSALRKFKSYYGLKGCEEKLRSLLEHNPFVDLAMADSMVDWSKAKVINL